MDIINDINEELPEHLRGRVILNIDPQYFHLWRERSEFPVKIEDQYKKKWYSSLSTQNLNNSLGNAIYLGYIDFVQEYLRKLEQKLNLNDLVGIDWIMDNMVSGFKAAIDHRDLKLLESMIGLVNQYLSVLIETSKSEEIDHLITEEFNKYWLVINQVVQTGNMKMIDLLISWVESWRQLNNVQIKNLMISGANFEVIQYFYQMLLNRQATDFTSIIDFCQKRSKNYRCYLVYQTLLDLINDDSLSSILSVQSEFEREIYLAIKNNENQDLKRFLVPKLQDLKTPTLINYYNPSFLRQALQEDNLSAVKIFYPIEEKLGYLINYQKYFDLFLYPRNFDLIDYLVDKMKISGLTLDDVINDFKSKNDPNLREVIDNLNQFN